MEALGTPVFQDWEEEETGKGDWESSEIGRNKGKVTEPERNLRVNLYITLNLALVLP